MNRAAGCGWGEGGLREPAYQAAGRVLMAVDCMWVIERPLGGFTCSLFTVILILR